MQILENLEQLTAYRQQRTGRVGFVPTMGALHAGHVSLVDIARQFSDDIIVSLFVNPTQFNEASDYEHYPRTFESDSAMCLAAGVDAVFCPPVEVMYPRDEVEVAVDVPALTRELEGEKRPGHFQGVCRVVAKLFNMVQPDVAVFGEKDYQQLAVIRAMVAGLAMPIQIIAGPTVREQDGLAMSSRNRRLSDEDRPKALGLYKALTRGVEMLTHAHETDAATVEAAMRDVMLAHEVEVEYAVVRDPVTLARLDLNDAQATREQNAVLLVAGRLGDVRLIDNMTCKISM